MSSLRCFLLHDLRHEVAHGLGRLVLLLPCVSPEGDVHGLARSQKGFTLVELIVVIAVLGILSLILVPQFSLYGDKAMGTTAAADARTAISVCTAHNMDSIDKLSQTYLNTYMSLVANTAGDAGLDASGSKYMQLNAQDVSKITYYYRRGDVVLKGNIDLTAGATTWETNLTDIKRFDSLAQGLKVTGSGGQTTLNTTATVGKLCNTASLTFPT